MVSELDVFGPSVSRWYASTVVPALYPLPRPLVNRSHLSRPFHPSHTLASRVGQGWTSPSPHRRAFMPFLQIADHPPLSPFTRSLSVPIAVCPLHLLQSNTPGWHQPSPWDVRFFVELALADREQTRSACGAVVPVPPLLCAAHILRNLSFRFCFVWSGPTVSRMSSKCC